MIGYRQGISRAILAMVALVGFVPIPAFSATPTTTDASDGSLIFIQNVGQFPAEARFEVLGLPTSLYLADDALWFTVLNRPRHTGVNVKLSFLGANPHPQLEPLGRRSTRLSYFIGNKSAGWKANVPAWGAVRYRNLYPGVDLDVAASSTRLALSMAAQSGTDSTPVRLRVEGAQAVSLTSDGLDISTDAGHLMMPLIATDLPATPTPRLVAQGTGAYDVTNAFAPPTARTPAWPSATGSDRPKAGKLAQPAATQSLLFSTYLGGSDNDEAHAIGLDAAGDVYVTGEAASIDFPHTTGAFQTSKSGGSSTFNVFAAVFDPKLVGAASLLYASFLGGNATTLGTASNDIGEGVAVDAGGNIYLTGETDSSDFPITTTTAAQPTIGGYVNNAFLTKLNPNAIGTAQLAYSTFLGGPGDDRGAAVAIDATGMAYVTGKTAGTFPITTNAYQTTFQSPPYDAFVAKVDPTKAGIPSLVYSTYLGAPQALPNQNSNDHGNAIAVDNAGNAYVTGSTQSLYFPTKNAFQGFATGFVTKLNAAGTGLVYSSFLGGSSTDEGHGIAVNAAGEAYVAGETSSPDFPTTSTGYQRSRVGSTAGFLTKVSASGTGVSYATYLGGSGDQCGCLGAIADFALAVAVDPFGSAYLTGFTSSSDFPHTSDAVQPTYGGGSSDAFLAKINPTLAGTASLVYSTWLGGGGHLESGGRRE